MVVEQQPYYADSFELKKGPYQTKSMSIEKKGHKYSMDTS